MSDFVIENIRLKELVLIVTKNKPFFDEFIDFIQKHNYQDIFTFISEREDKKINSVLTDYFTETKFRNCVYDGIGRPYTQEKSKWIFIAWLLRDAPMQRLQPLLASIKEKTTVKKKIVLVKRLIKYVAPILHEQGHWDWYAIAEVMLQRLEGSRRALKGSLFEAIVRTQLSELFKRNKLRLTVTSHQVTLNDETYDIEIVGNKGQILMPVKTRETMGGGHATLFTRDIYKSISVARNNGFMCIPVIIAESWGGNLDGLDCENYVHIPLNPNQIEKINPLLKRRLRSLLTVFSSIL